MRGMSAPIAPVDRVLRDGSTVRIRPATPEDRVRVERYLIELSPESRCLRFPSPVVAMAEMHPEIVEMDCNPVKVLQRGAVVVDARVRIEPVRSGHDH